MKANYSQQENALRLMASNVLTMGFLILFLSFRSLPLLFVFPTLLAFGVARWGGRALLNSFFADRLLPVGTIGAMLWLGMVVCQPHPLWLAGFWMMVGTALIGLSGVLALPQGIELNAAPSHITPSPFLTHPPRLNRLLSIVFGWLLWTFSEIPIGWRAPLTVLFITLGVAGIGNWRLGVHPDSRQIKISFSGVPGLAGSYFFGFDRFQSVLLVKLQEGEISWVQLSGRSEEVTLPGVMLDTASTEGELTEVLKQRYPLARQEATRDSLQMMGILLPQGTGVLLGLGWILVGVAIWWSLRLPEELGIACTWLLGGTCLLSPILARWVFQSLVPGSIPPRSGGENPLWEVGVVLMIVTLVNQPHGVLLGLAALTFLCWGVGVHTLQLVRTVPLRQAH